MTEPTDDLRRAVGMAIEEGLRKSPWFGNAADAAIAAYRQHPDGAAADWKQAARITRLEKALSTILNGGVSFAALTREEYEFVREARAALDPAP